ncbi:hypothetical protein [Streptomyces virginiae]|uniref:hypothetical protein n=1 Tax=Streptomyces virginiae TaxID=1961 RepID=UPI003253A064
MYAIRVDLLPDGAAQALASCPTLGVGEQVEGDAQLGIAHVSLVHVAPYVVAMTFVLAADLLAAELLARAAWDHWLAHERLAGWQLVSCAGSLQLGVWAALEASKRHVDW